VAAGSAVGGPPAAGGSESLSDVEREHIVRTLEQVHGNKSRAARALGLSRRRLYRLLDRHGLVHMIQRRECEADGDVAANEEPKHHPGSPASVGYDGR
jgi:hypothetical protein